MQPFVSVLGTELELTSKEIADIIWLALQMQESDGAETAIPLEPSPPQRTEERSTHSPSLTDPDEKLDRSSSTTSAEVHHQSDANQAGFGKRLTLQVPDARSLREPLSLARSLKPLLQQVVTGWSTVLDEAATVERIADEQIWLPVLKPALEPWLDLALVVDESGSMQIWQRTITELRRLLSHYGVFRDVRVWGLVTDEQGQVKLRSGVGATARQQATRRPSELIDPSGRRLILVATDCVASGWQDGSVLSALKLWAKSGPLAIVQMLPEWLWVRTGLGFASAVKLQSLLPGVPNQQLVVKDLSPWDEVDLEAGIKVPVMTLEPEPFAVWTEMVMGKGGVCSSGFVFELEAVIPNRQVTQLSNMAVEGSAEQRVQRFRVTASPMARRLAGLLAAAPVISLPVVRIIQDRLLSESRQVHVAEVFLGGLLKPLAEVEAEMNPDAMQYDFLNGVRELLLESVPTSDSVNVLTAVSKFVAQRLGLSLHDFAAILSNPRQEKNHELANQSRPFAMITAQILRQLGGDYARFAEELEETIQIVPQPISRPKTNNQKMKPEELKRFFNASNPAKLLNISNPSDRRYYIDFSSVRSGEIIEELKRTITLSDEETCQLFTGHRGSGKSIELLRLKAELENQGFHVVHFESDKYLDMTDIDVSDILLVIALHISKSLDSLIRLQPNYFQNLFSDIGNLLQTSLELESFDLSVGIAQITRQAKESPRLRHKLREILEPQTKILLDSINKDILEKATDKLRQNKIRGLVTIIDNLEKVGQRLLPSGHKQLEYLFIERGAQLRGLQCHLVYTVPIELLFSPQHEVMVDQLGGGIGPKVLPMVPTHCRDGKDHNEGLNLLKQMVMARAFPNESINKRLDLANIKQIFDTPETLDRLCHISGGRVRSLLSLLYHCLQIQDPPITRSLLERAITERLNQYRQATPASQWQVLRQIAQQKPTSIADPDHQLLFRHSRAFEYRDRNECWFDINPILAEAPEMEKKHDKSTNA